MCKFFFTSLPTEKMARSLENGSKMTVVVVKDQKVDGRSEGPEGVAIHNHLRVYIAAAI